MCAFDMPDYLIPVVLYLHYPMMDANCEVIRYVIFCHSASS
jgi:hypothetical protein